MNNPLRSKTTLLTAGIFGILLCSFRPTTVSAAQTDTINQTADAVSVERLRLLGEKIDSLEVEKQAQKRNGSPLTELEEKTAAFRDSIKTIRIGLRQGAVSGDAGAVVPEKKPSVWGYFKKLLPGPENRLIDRILLAAGAITIVVGLFFLIVLFALKSRRKKQTVAKNQTRKAAAQYEKVQRKEVEAPPSAFPDSFKNTASESAALASLIPPPASATPVRTKPQQRRPENPGDDLKNLVLKGNADGLDEKEISRRYHLSIDQVRLMLKMAKKQ
jgi:hypothetical protein